MESSAGSDISSRGKRPDEIDESKREICSNRKTRRKVFQKII